MFKELLIASSLRCCSIKTLASLQIELHTDIQIFRYSGSDIQVFRHGQPSYLALFLRLQVFLQLQTYKQVRLRI